MGLLNNVGLSPVLQDSHRNGASAPAAAGKATPMSAKAAQQRNTVTNYFPVLQDGAGSRGSEQATGDRPQPAAQAETLEEGPLYVAAEEAWQAEKAELHDRLSVLENQLELAKEEADSLR